MANCVHSESFSASSASPTAAYTITQPARLQQAQARMGVSVTELLSGQMIRPGQTMTVQEVEPLVATALTMTAQEQAQQRENRRILPPAGAAPA